MNGAVQPLMPTPQNHSTAHSAAIQQGADEVLRIFFGKDRLPKLSPRELFAQQKYSPPEKAAARASKEKDVLLGTLYEKGTLPKPPAQERNDLSVELGRTIARAAIEKVEILGDICGKDKLSEPSVQERMNLPTAEVTAVTPTNTVLDTDQKERLEELLIEERRKLREAEEKIAKLAEDLREKDAAIAQLRDDNRALKEMLRRKLGASPQLDEDVSMLGTGNPDGHGEPDQSLDDMTLFGDCSVDAADGEFLQPEDLLRSLSPDPLVSDESTHFTPQCMHTPLAIVDPEPDNIHEQSSDGLSQALDQALDGSFTDGYRSSEPEKEDCTFHQTEEVTSTVPLNGPKHIFKPVRYPLRTIRTPASPLRPEERGRGFDLDSDSDESSQGSDADGD